MTDNESPFTPPFDPPDIAGALTVATQAAAEGQLRDQFALAALRAILPFHADWAKPSAIARCCYDMADAMMAARSAGE